MSIKQDIIEAIDGNAIDQKTLDRYYKAEDLFLSCLASGHFDIREQTLPNNTPSYSIVIRPKQSDPKSANEIVITQEFLTTYYKNWLDEAAQAGFLEVLPEEYRDYFTNSLETDDKLETLKVVREGIKKKDPARLQARKNQEKLANEKDYQRITAKEMDALTPELMSQIKNNKLDVRAKTLRPRTIRPDFLDPQPFSFELKGSGVILIHPGKDQKARYILPADFKAWYDKLSKGKQDEIKQCPGYKDYFEKYAAKDKMFQSLMDVQAARIKSSGTSLQPASLTSSSYHQSAAGAQGLYSSSTPLAIAPSLVSQIAQTNDWSVGETVEPNTATGERFRIVQAAGKPDSNIKMYEKRVGIDEPFNAEKAGMAAKVAAAVPGTEAIIVRNERNDLGILKDVFIEVIKAGKLPIVESQGTAPGIPPRNQDEVIATLGEEARNKLSELISAAPPHVRDNYYRTTRANTMASPPAEPDRRVLGMS